MNLRPSLLSGAILGAVLLTNPVRGGRTIADDAPTAAPDETQADSAVGADAATAVPSERQAELAAFLKDYNDLFPPTGVWLSGQFTRPNPYRFDQSQKFTGNFQKTPEGNYEQPGSCESEWFTNGVSQGAREVETTTHKLTVENGKVVIYAIHVTQAGQRNVYGPSNVAREGNAIVFRDVNPAGVSGGNWVQSTFFRKRDGTLGSTRHWNADYFDDWVASDPPAADR